MTLSALDVVAWVKGSRATGLAYGTPASFSASSAGNAGGTTIVATMLQGYSTGDSDFVGLWVRVLSGAASTGREDGAPLMRRIIAYAYSTGTLILNDSIGFQTADGDLFELLEPPTGYISPTAAGETTSLVDATRDEPADWWAGSAAQGGPYVTVVNADAVAATAHPLIGNSLSAGLISCASTLGASTAVGDLYEAWQYPEIVGGGDLGVKRGNVDRPAITGCIGGQPTLAGLMDGGGSATLLFRGPGAGREGSAAECDVLLGCPLDVEAGASDVSLGADSTTTNFVIDSGTPVAGRLYLTEAGDVAMCSAFSAPNATMTPAVRTAPKNGETLYLLRQYETPSDYATNYVIPIERWYGTRVWEHIFDAVPRLTIDFERGQPTKINATFLASQGSGKQRTSSSRQWRAIRPTVTPKMLSHLRVVLGSTELEVRKASLDLGIEYAVQTNMAAPEMTDGYGWRKDRPSGTIDIWLDADGRAALLDLEARTAGLRLLIQAGHGHGDNGTLAFFCEEVELTDVPIIDDGGKRAVTLTWAEVEDTTQTTLPRWCLGYV